MLRLGPMVRSLGNLERSESFSLKISPLFSVFLFLWITLNHILKMRKLPPTFLHATCPFLDFFSSFSLFLFFFIFRSLNFSIILHLSLLFSLRHINLFIIFPWVLLYNFHIFSFSLGFTYGFNNHLINIHLKFPENTQVGSIIPGIYKNFIIKILGYFWGVTPTFYISPTALI